MRACEGAGWRCRWAVLELVLPWAALWGQAGLGIAVIVLKMATMAVAQGHVSAASFGAAGHCEAVG